MPSANPSMEHSPLFHSGVPLYAACQRTLDRRCARFDRSWTIGVSPRPVISLQGVARRPCRRVICRPLVASLTGMKRQDRRMWFPSGLIAVPDGQIGVPPEATASFDRAPPGHAARARRTAYHDTLVSTAIGNSPSCGPGPPPVCPAPGTDRFICQLIILPNICFRQDF